MAIKQGRYITADTTGKKEMAIRTTELDKVKDDPFVRKSEVQQTVNNSTLPVSSRAVNLTIESINNDLDLKAGKTELEGLATEDYVNEKIDEKEVGITEPELISKSVGSNKWMREGAFGLGGNGYIQPPEEVLVSGFYGGIGASGGAFKYDPFITAVRGSNSKFQIGTHNADLHFRFFRTSTNSYSDLFKLYSPNNTQLDKNGVLHYGSETPINTLNTSDMADTVVDNDLLTVTSGAVYRATRQLMDQIAILEARVKELEDGGV